MEAGGPKYEMTQVVGTFLKNNVNIVSTIFKNT